MNKEELKKLEKSMENATEEERKQAMKKYLKNLELNLSMPHVENSKLLKGKKNFYYNVFIKNKTSKKYFTFLFHDSVSNYEKNKKCNMLDVLNSIVIDGQAYTYNNNFVDFCICFGYEIETEEDKQEAMKIYNACKKMYFDFIETFNNNDFEILQAIFNQY